MWRTHEPLWKIPVRRIVRSKYICSWQRSSLAMNHVEQPNYSSLLRLSQNNGDVLSEISGRLNVIVTEIGSAAARLYRDPLPEVGVLPGLSACQRVSTFIDVLRGNRTKISELSEHSSSFSSIVL